jgi:hypothetical protein
MEELTYDELMRIHAREKGPTISSIHPNFYELAGKLLSTYDKSDPAGMREYNNALKMIKYIYQRRIEKTLNLALSFNKGIEPPPEMLQNEREIYEKVVDILKKNEIETDKKLICQGDNVCNIENIEPVVSKKDTKIAVRIMKDLDEFLSFNGSLIGPLKQNTVVELEKEDADMLIELGSAEKVES